MPDTVPIAPEAPNSRALILPGGGMRVAYQAGAVKALHDAGLRYSIADAASGGTMNLAALLGGATPDQLCSRWRSLPVSGFVSPRPLSAYARFPNTGALSGFDGIERRIFPHLGIDPARVRTARGVTATFNVCDFADKVAVPIPQGEITQELLLAGISLPLATPPVQYHGRLWTDAVWIRDCNLLAAVSAGADELWVVWCIGNTPNFHDGLLDQYVHMIEMAAIGRLNDELAAIAARNATHPGARPIRVHVIHPERPIPLDPEFLSGKVDAATLVAYGYRDAMRYLAHAAPEGTPLDPRATKMAEHGRGVTFREQMSGRITFGETDPQRGYDDPAAFPLTLHGTIDIDDIAAFVIDPDHVGDLVGHIEIQRRGGWLPAITGRFGLFTPTSDPALVYMVYEMAIMLDGRPHCFAGRKHVRIAGPWRLWPATTTLFVQVHAGEGRDGPVVAAGVLRLGVPGLLALLGTLRARGCVGLRSRIWAVGLFFRFFAAELARIFLWRRPA